MFDIEIWEVYSLNQEVPEHGRHRKKLREIHDIRRYDPLDLPLTPPLIFSQFQIFPQSPTLTHGSPKISLLETVPKLPAN